MVIFHSYVNLPEGKWEHITVTILWFGPKMEHCVLSWFPVSYFSLWISLAYNGSTLFLLLKPHSTFIVGYINT